MGNRIQILREGSLKLHLIMKKLNVLEDYCTGCGLCASVRNVPFVKDNKGFSKPILTEDDLPFCESVCPVTGKLWDSQSGEIWGDKKQIYLGWSEDYEIREQASSGGVLTAMCLYLIEQGIVDGIIQTRRSELVPYATETIISKNREEILQCMGSRYSISTPLSDIKQSVESGKRYCFVGKPCDVYTLRAFMRQDAALKQSIVLTMSFFCAGVPSVDAQKKLLERLECKEEDCTELRYRGNGWPGFATAKNKNGLMKRITYDESWGQILGRDIRKICRFCMDGIGSFADIACGDAWYLKEGKPDFSEADGRNVIFARNKIGENFLLQAQSSGYVHLDKYDSWTIDLPLIQRYQFERRATMKAMLLAMRLLGKSAPFYPPKLLTLYAKEASLNKEIKRFIGTFKRILQGKV